MKILIATPVLIKSNSPFNHLLNDILSECILNNIHVHRIIATLNGQVDDELELKRDKLISYEATKCRQVNKSNFIQRYFNDIFISLKMSMKIFKHRDIDKVIVINPQTAIVPIIFSRLCGKKVVFLLQDIWPYNAVFGKMIKEHGVIFKCFNLVQKICYKLSHNIITISEDMKKTLLKDGVKEEKITVSYNWGYSDELKEISVEENIFIRKYSLDISKFNIVYAGNIGKMQNVEIIVKAALKLKKNNEIKFHIIGEGVEKENIKEFIRLNNLSNVQVYDYQEEYLAQHIYSFADINMIPLQEGVIRTALPSKTPICIAAKKNIIACIEKESEISKRLSSYNVASFVGNDEEQLVDTILKYYKDNRVIGNNDKCYREVFSREENLRKYIEVILG